MRPISRPSALIEIRAETLWLEGVAEAVDRVLALLNAAGGIANETKISRVDLCVDLLVPAEFWRVELIPHRVTKAFEYTAHGRAEALTGIQIGRGDLQCRLYDKELEINLKSKKSWMHSVWGLEEIPDDQRAIRIEFQVRREVLKQLGLNSVWDFLNHPRNLWAYCTTKWLEFRTPPGVHHTMQETMPFWTTVQEGFLGGQAGHPLIRAKAVEVKKRQLAQQLMGQLTSLIAIDTDKLVPQVTLQGELDRVTESADLLGMTDAELSERVRLKLGKYAKGRAKFEQAQRERRAKGLPQWRTQGGKTE
jgi:hypothetical protein